MLTSLKLEGWKSFGKDRGRSELIFAPLTLLVGPNASGKSNALDALRFLQGAALDYPLGDVLRGRWEGQREIWPAIRGSVVEASHVGDVIGFGRDREIGDTICSRLEDLSHFATLRDAKNIEQLLSTGWLERAL